MQEKEQVKKENQKAQLLAAAIVEGNQNSERRGGGYRPNRTRFRSGRNRSLDKD